MTESTYPVFNDGQPFKVSSPSGSTLNSGSDGLRTPTPSSGSSTLACNDDDRSAQLAELSSQIKSAQQAWADYLLARWNHMPRREVTGYPVPPNNQTNSTSQTQTQPALPTFFACSYYQDFPASFEEWLDLKGFEPVEFSSQYYTLQAWYDMEALVHVQNINHRQIGPACPPVALYAFDSNNPPPFVDLTKFAGPSGLRVVKISNVSTLFLCSRHLIASSLFPHHLPSAPSELSVHLK
jgi:hypothetical protein